MPQWQKKKTEREKMETIGKAWHIIGYTLNGNYFCEEHAIKHGASLGGGWNGDEVSPVFASDELGDIACLFCEGNQ